MRTSRPFPVEAHDDDCPLTQEDTVDLVTAALGGDWPRVEQGLDRADGARRLPALLRRRVGSASVGERLTTAFADAPTAPVALGHRRLAFGLHVCSLGSPEAAASWARLMGPELAASLVEAGGILETAAASPAVLGALLGTAGDGPAEQDAIWLAHAPRVLGRLLREGRPEGLALAGSWLASAVEGGRLDGAAAAALLSRVPALIGLGRQVPALAPLVQRLRRLALSAARASTDRPAV